MSVKVTKNPTSLALRRHPTITFGETTTLRATLTGGDPSRRWCSSGVRAARGTRSPHVRWGPTGSRRSRCSPRARRGTGPCSSSRRAMAGSESARPGAGARGDGQPDDRQGGQGGRYTVYACCTSYFYVKLPLHPNVNGPPSRSTTATEVAAPRLRHV
jgi:hypothetical protein